MMRYPGVIQRTTTVVVLLSMIALLMMQVSLAARGPSASDLLFDDEDSLQLMSQTMHLVEVDNIELDDQFAHASKEPERPVIKITVEGDYDTSIERVIDTTYHMQLWPKYADGSNATTASVMLEFEVQPLELVDLVHENPNDDTHWHISYKLKGPSQKFGFSISASDIVIERNPFVFETARKIYPKGSFLRPGSGASVYATQVWRAGDTNTIVLHALDPFGKPPANFSGLDVQPGDKNDTCRFGMEFERENGTIRLLFTQNVVGNYTYHVTILGQDVIGSPFNATVLPAALSSESVYVSEYCYSCWRAHLGREEAIFILLRDQFGNAVADGRLASPNVTVQVYPAPKPELADFSFSVSLLLNDSDPGANGIHVIRYTSNSMVPRAVLVFVDDSMIRSFEIETVHESPNPPGQWFWWGPFPYFTPVMSSDYKALLTILGVQREFMDHTGRVHVDPNPPPPTSPVLQQPSEDEIQHAMQMLKPPSPPKAEQPPIPEDDEPEEQDSDDPLRQLHSLQKKLAKLQAQQQQEQQAPAEMTAEELSKLRQSAYDHLMARRREALHQESQNQAQAHLTLLQHNMDVEAWTLPSFGHFEVSTNETFMLACYGVDFFEINSTRYASDTWHVQQWPNGTQLTIYVEVTRSSPATIGQQPEFSWRCAIQGEEDVPRVSISTSSSVVLPSCYEGQLASPFGSVPVVLVHEHAQSLSLSFDTNVTGLAISLVSSTTEPQVHFDGAYPSALHFEIRNTTAPDGAVACTAELPMVLNWQLGADSRQTEQPDDSPSVPLRLALPQMPENASVALTYRDFDNSVRQALAYPPLGDCAIEQAGCPVILVLMSHANFDDLLAAFERRADAWLLIPQSRRGFGSVLSHSGLVDARSALAALEALERMSMRTPLRRADIHRVIVLPFEDRDASYAVQFAVQNQDIVIGLFASQAFHKPAHRLPALYSVSPHQRAVLEACITHQNSELVATTPALKVPVLVEIGTALMPRWKEALLVDRLSSAGLRMFKTQQSRFVADLKLFITGAISNSLQQEQDKAEASPTRDKQQQQQHPAFHEHLGAAGILLGPLTIVYPSADAENGDYQRYAWYLATQLYQSIGSTPAVVSDTSFLRDADQRETLSNVIVLGSPQLNRVAHELLDCQPEDSILRAERKASITTPNGVSLADSDYGVVALLPHLCPRHKPLVNKALLAAGTSLPLFLLAANRVPRSTFSLVPDFLIVGGSATSATLKIADAGFWTRHP